MLGKKFNGKVYQFYGSYNRKSDAQGLAKRFRAGGEPARVVKDSTGQWGVYVRYSKSRGFGR